MVPIVNINSIGNYLKCRPEIISSDNNPINLNSKSKGDKTLKSELHEQDSKHRTLLSWILQIWE